LFFAAAVGGGINAVAGGGSFVAFPALLFTGVAPVEANATNTLALWIGTTSSGGAYRKRLKLSRRVMIPLIAIVAAIVTASVARADTLTDITSQAAQGANDSVSWSQLGADATTLGTSFDASSVLGVSVAGGFAAGTAPTSLIAVGGGLALLRSTSEALSVLQALPIDISPPPALWEIKCVGLVLIFVYTFFKFAWAYRLFNYVAILLGSMPPASQRDTPQAEAHVVRTTRLFEAAGRHFNRGQRAFFFALGYLGWFVSPWVLFISTAAVVIVTWRRQFASSAWRAMGS